MLPAIKTIVRDYVYTMNFGEGHRCPLACLLKEEQQLLKLVSGQEQSILDVVKAMEATSNHSILYAITNRSQGDAAISVADHVKHLHASAE